MAKSKHGKRYPSEFHRQLVLTTSEREELVLLRRENKHLRMEPDAGSP